MIACRTARICARNCVLILGLLWSYKERVAVLCALFTHMLQGAIVGTEAI